MKGKTIAQKSYEKFAMIVFSLLKRDLGVDYQVAIIKAKDEYNNECLILSQLTEEDSVIPIARFLSQSDCESLEPVMNTMEPITKLFWKLIRKEKRVKFSDFQKDIKIPELSEKESLDKIGL